MRQKPFTLYITGSGHSGTTLLDMMLGGHNKIASLGEVGALQFNLSPQGDSDRCACGEFVPDCQFWQRIDEALRRCADKETTGIYGLLLADPAQEIRRFGDGQFHSRLPGERRVTSSIIRDFALILNSRLVLDLGSRVSELAAMWCCIFRDRNRLYEAARIAHQTPIVVDSTKNPGYLKGIWWYRSASMKFIEVIRDGRALCWARVRREGWSMERAVKIWTTEYRKRQIALRGLPRADVLRIYYEDLASSPEKELHRICNFLDIDPQIENMLRFRDARHNLGGNPMRYRQCEGQVRLDERWKEEMAHAELRQFEKKGGWLNRQLGYN